MVANAKVLKDAGVSAPPKTIDAFIESLKAIGDPAAVDVLTWAAFGEKRGLATLAAQALAGMDTPEALAAGPVRARPALLRQFQSSQR